MSDNSNFHKFSAADRLALAAHAAGALATVLFTLSSILRALEQGGKIPEPAPAWPAASSREPPNPAKNYFS